MNSDELPQALHPAELTEALGRSGALETGRVLEVAAQSSRLTTLSHIVRVRVTYEGAEAGR